MKKKYAIGADIGGSHISTILVDVDTGDVIAESMAEQNVDTHAAANEILDDWAIAIQKTMNYASEEDLAGIGFAMPGPFDYEYGIALFENVAKFENLYGINISNELKKRLDLPQETPFRYLNDAMSFAVGECWVGQASAYKNVIAITLGTGFGSAFLTDGVPIIEGDRVPSMGYVYNIPYEKGIADDYFSTRWLVNEYESRTGKRCKGVKEIADNAKTENKAQELFTDFGYNMAIFLNPLMKNFDADCLVIGGKISGAYSLFGSSFEETLKQKGISIKIIISELMESAAMVGSSRLLESLFWSRIEPLVSKI